MESTLVRTDIYENYLLVEGSEDEHVFKQLLTQYRVFEGFEGKRETFEIREHGGVDNLLKARVLRSYLVGDESKRYGIVIDADESLDIRWQQVKSILEDRNVGYRNMPESPLSHGTILQQEGLATVGIWLMPDNQIPGIMESFIGWLVPRNDLLWPMAGDIVQKVIERDRRFRKSYLDKACIHTWLAWQKDPGTSLGMSINKHYVDANAPFAQNFISWIRNLFNLN